MNTNDTTATTDTTTRVAKRKTYAKKIQGSFRVKNPNNNVVVNVTKRNVSDIPAYESILFPEMNDLDIIIRNILRDGDDIVWAESINVIDIMTIVDILNDVHDVKVELSFPATNANVMYVKFVGEFDEYSDPRN